MIGNLPRISALVKILAQIWGDVSLARKWSLEGDFNGMHILCSGLIQRKEFGYQMHALSTFSIELGVFLVLALYVHWCHSLLASFHGFNPKH